MVDRQVAGGEADVACAVRDAGAQRTIMVRGPADAQILAGDVDIGDQRHNAEVIAWSAHWATHRRGDLTAWRAVRRPNIDEHTAEVSLSCAVLDPQLDGMLPLTELGVANGEELFGSTVTSVASSRLLLHQPQVPADHLRHH